MSQRILTILLTFPLICWGGLVNAIIMDYQGNNFTDSSLTGPTTPSDQYTTSDSVNGWIELSAMLAPNLDQESVTPLSFSFSDGVNTFDETTATTSLFYFWTDASGTITDWQVLVRSFPDITGGGLIGEITTSSTVIGPIYTTIADTGSNTLCGPASTSASCVISGDPFYYQDAFVGDAPGVWSVKAAVPEPSTLALLSLGLLGIGATRKLKKH